MFLRYILLGFILIMNLLTFAMYGIDKRRAIHKGRRIPELTLILTALFGGSAGALIAMAVFRHKTKHDKFKYGIPSMLLLNIVIFVYLYILFKP